MKILLLPVIAFAVTMVVSSNASAQLMERIVIKDYSLRWNDAGSGNDNDLALWHPKIPKGYFVFGSVGVSSNKTNPNGRLVSYAFKPLSKIQIKGQSGLKDLIVHPVDYKLVWSDKGSGADKDGSIWEPIPPKGYVFLGHVAQSGYSKPSKWDSACILDTTSTLEIRDGRSFRLSYSWWSNGVAKSQSSLVGLFNGDLYRNGPDTVVISTVTTNAQRGMVYCMKTRFSDNTLTLSKQKGFVDIKSSAIKQR